MYVTYVGQNVPIERERNKDEEEYEETDDGGGEVAKLCLHTVYVLPEGPSRSRGTV